MSLSSDGNILAVGDGLTWVFQWVVTTWKQVGQVIDQFGKSVLLSADGQILAINSNDVGVFQWNGTSWDQRGNAVLDLTASYSYSVSLSSDGTVVAINVVRSGSFHSPGLVQVHQWLDNAWVQVGKNIRGEARGGVSLSGNGRTFAAGGKNDHNVNGLYSGHVRVYSCN